MLRTLGSIACGSGPSALCLAHTSRLRSRRSAYRRRTEASALGHTHCRRQNCPSGGQDVPGTGGGAAVPHSAAVWGSLAHAEVVDDEQVRAGPARRGSLCGFRRASPRRVLRGRCAFPGRGRGSPVESRRGRSLRQDHSCPTAGWSIKRAVASSKTSARLILGPGRRAVSAGTCRGGSPTIGLCPYSTWPSLPGSVAMTARASTAGRCRSVATTRGTLA